MINTEVVELKDVSVKMGKGSMYASAIEQALDLKKGEGLKVSNPANTHLRNTLYQLIARKGLGDQLGIVVANKETYLIKK